MMMRTSVPTATPDLGDRLAGVLLGTALGDALGLPAEGMSAAAIARRFGRMDRFRILGKTGFVSDDTEQSALVAHSLIRYPDDVGACTRAFRYAMLGWFLRLPWGIGFGTLRACLRIAVGLHPSGVRSAGNGAAMRAAVVGAFFADDPDARRQFGDALARVTHTDQRAVAGAMCVADMTAAAMAPEGATALDCFKVARAACEEPALGAALDQAAVLAERRVSTHDAAEELHTSGFVMHTVPFAMFCFLRYGKEPLIAIQEVIVAGGDTDSIGAIVGAWVGALHGASGLPQHLLDRLHDGPFGPSHLRALAQALRRVREGERPDPVRYSPVAALVRNLALYPVVLAHGLRRLIPW